MKMWEQYLRPERNPERVRAFLEVHRKIVDPVVHELQVDLVEYLWHVQK